MNGPSFLQIMLYTMKGVLAEMEPEQRREFEACAEKLRQTVVAYGELGEVAGSIVGLELAVKNIDRTRESAAKS